MGPHGLRPIGAFGGSTYVKLNPFMLIKKNTSPCLFFVIDGPIKHKNGFEKWIFYLKGNRNQLYQIYMSHSYPTNERMTNHIFIYFKFILFDFIFSFCWCVFIWLVDMNEIEKFRISDFYPLLTTQMCHDGYLCIFLLF